MSTPAQQHAEVAARLREAGCVFAEDEATLLISSTSTAAQLDEAIRLRLAGLPLEHIVGWASFSGHRIRLAPRVFVPRRRTELLAREAIALTRPGDVVVDLCCGSGALVVAVAAAVSGIELHASDIDPIAVQCARRNVEPWRGHVYEGDLFDALPRALRGTVRIVVANAPYVPTSRIALLPAEAREHEERVALDGGVDGLDVHRRIAAEVSAWLEPGGRVLVEVTLPQAAAIVDAFLAAGLTTTMTTSSEWDVTVVCGTSAPSEM